MGLDMYAADKLQARNCFTLVLIYGKTRKDACMIDY
jgi:hypothetical protein